MALSSRATVGQAGSGRPSVVVFLLIALSMFRRRRGSLLAFAGGAAFFQALVAVSFPAIGGIETVTSVIGTFPDGLRALLKLAPNLQAGFGAQDYLAFTWFHPVFLGLGSAFVVGRAAGGLAEAVERGSVYLTLSRPVPRWTLVAGVALEMFAGLGVFVLASWLGMVAGVASARLGPLPLDRYLLVALAAWGLFAALGGGSLVISSVLSRASLAGGLAAAWTLLSFVLDVIPAVYNSPLAWLNPWHHYFPQEIVATGRLPAGGLLVLVAWALAGTGAAAVLFSRRDLG
jgi:ABC-type transport system involved in multi-copper enzyme maturation permease subunit